MYTADNARQKSSDDLDERIENAVKNHPVDGKNGAYLRVYIEDAFVHTIGEELEKRGFINIDVPDICLKGDVYFEW